MSAWGFDPAIYELNTAAWLHDLSKRAGQPITLGDVPEDEWSRVIVPGVDAIWLLGVWDRSPEAARLALDSPSHIADFEATLADFDLADVIGSAYSIRNYEVDSRFGGRAGLLAARQTLAARGIRLILDFVPNHVAPDHPWLATHADYFVRGDANDLARAPVEFLEVGDAVIARGRDPYFPPWPDVAQLNVFAPGLRQAAIDTLVDIGHLADGVRCDMAMLLLNDVFRRIWGDRPGPVPATEYWADVISAVRAVHPEMLFAAEAYWDLEMGTPAARLRLLLRQTSLRPAAARRRSRRARSPPRRPRVSARSSALHRKPRRTTGRARVRPARPSSGCRHHCDVAGSHAVARRPVRGLAHPRTGAARATPGRARR
jgi:hypothetical protein